MTPQFEAFIAPARAYPQIWRLILGFVVMLFVFVLGTMIVVGGGWAIFGGGAPLTEWAAAFTAAATATDTLVLLATFVPMAIAPMVAAKWLHKRGPGTLFGRSALVLRDFGRAALTVAAVFTLSLLIWRLFNRPIPNLDLSLWLMLLPLTVVGLIVQTGAEELVFRGYLQQQLAARFRWRAVWLIVPAILFGIVHYDPVSAGGNAPYIVLGAGLFGLIAGDLTARTGSLGAAWGFHFANNFFAVALLSTTGTIDGLSLYRTPYSIDETAAFGSLILIDAAFLLLCWWLVRRVVAR